jgi:hypothetical protein
MACVTLCRRRQAHRDRHSTDVSPVLPPQAEYNRDPVTGYAPGEHAAWAASQTPGKQVARRVRDLRLLDQARTPEEEKEVWRYLQQRQGLRQELQQPLEMQVHAEDTVGGVRPAA